MAQTMLQKAMAVKTTRRVRGPEYSPQLLEVSCAWFEGKVSDAQVAVALGTKSTNMGARAAYSLKRAIANGAAVITIKERK